LLPVFAVLGGILFLGESMQGQVIFGGTIVICGVGIILTDRG